MLEDGQALGSVFRTAFRTALGLSEQCVGRIEGGTKIPAVSRRLVVFLRGQTHAGVDRLHKNRRQFAGNALVAGTVDRDRQGVLHQTAGDGHFQTVIGGVHCDVADELIEQPHQLPVVRFQFLLRTRVCAIGDPFSSVQEPLLQVKPAGTVQISAGVIVELVYLFDAADELIQGVRHRRLPFLAGEGHTTLAQVAQIREGELPRGQQHERVGRAIGHTVGFHIEVRLERVRSAVNTSLLHPHVVDECVQRDFGHRNAGILQPGKDGIRLRLAQRLWIALLLRLQPVVDSLAGPVLIELVQDVLGLLVDALLVVPVNLDPECLAQRQHHRIGTRSGVGGHIDDASSRQEHFSHELARLGVE